MRTGPSPPALSSRMTFAFSPPLPAAPAAPPPQPFRNFPVRVPQQTVVGKKIGPRLPRKHRRIGGEKSVACFLGKKRVRRKGDQGYLHADRPDVDADVHGVSPKKKKSLVRFVQTHIDHTNAVPPEGCAGKTTGYASVSGDAPPLGPPPGKGA